MFLKKIRPQKKSSSLGEFLCEMDFLFVGFGLCGGVGAEIKWFKCYIKMPLKSSLCESYTKALMLLVLTNEPESFL